MAAAGPVSLVRSLASGMQRLVGRGCNGVIFGPNRQTCNAKLSSLLLFLGRPASSPHHQTGEFMRSISVPGVDAGDKTSRIGICGPQPASHVRPGRSRAPHPQPQVPRALQPIPPRHTSSCLAPSQAQHPVASTYRSESHSDTPPASSVDTSSFPHIETSCRSVSTSIFVN
ncbi:hypothetical protein EJ04DRAFT_610085 [Polyplosphaeria fusca]|uniref:Uncharacterized protein n=1 Tax=Polyplosphaeria fusca TaxID=682080 RepID=A0A9P4V017_9PLEO|nr:hypothetical protein EJ04DRAFT_610085 [Polyplosphaeria fusca]